MTNEINTEWEVAFGRTNMFVSTTCDRDTFIARLKELAIDCKNLRPVVMETNIFDFLYENTNTTPEQHTSIVNDLKFRLSNPIDTRFGHLRFFEEEFGDTRVFFAFAPETDDVWKHRIAEIRRRLFTT